MARFLILTYGILSYTIGLGGLVFFIIFAGGWEFLPWQIDADTSGPVLNSILINTGLILLFSLQHTVMARRGFKQGWTQVVPAAIERSTYVLFSGLALILISVCWQTLPGVLWQIENTAIRYALTTLQLAGWAIVVLSSFLINHFELFGLQQVYFHFIQRPEPDATFTDRYLYKIVRHPLQLGVLIGLWVTPTMTMTHLMLSASMTAQRFTASEVRL